MFGITKEMSITLVTSLVNVSCHTKCLSLSNQKCEIQPIFINWHPNEYRQELHCYPFAVKLDRCVGSCNTFNELFKKVCVPNKIEALNINAFNMIICRNKWIKYFNKMYIMQCKFNLMEENVIRIK